MANVIKVVLSNTILFTIGDEIEPRKKPIEENTWRANVDV